MTARLNVVAVICSELGENTCSCASVRRSQWEVECCCLDVQITPLGAAKAQV